MTSKSGNNFITMRNDILFLFVAAEEVVIALDCRHLGNRQGQTGTDWDKLVMSKSTQIHRGQAIFGVLLHLTVLNHSPRLTCQIAVAPEWTISRNSDLCSFFNSCNIVNVVIHSSQNIGVRQSGFVIRIWPLKSQDTLLDFS
jgi:hypothetical protein